MEILDCYFCGEEEEVNNLETDDAGMYFCDDCQRWQCNTSECGCMCSATDDELFDALVDAGTSPRELVDSGVQNLRESMKELVKQPGFGKFYMASNPHYVDTLAVRIYQEAEKRMQEA